MSKFDEMKKKYGDAKLNGLTVALTEQAYIDNYGTHGEVRYYARAIDMDDNRYMVTWETSIDWDNHVCDEEQQQDSRGQDIPLSCYWCEDESNACDWDNPIKIELID